MAVRRMRSSTTSSTVCVSASVEELSIVQEKEIESFIPSMASHRQRYEQHPELRKFNSQERFSAMRSGPAWPPFPIRGAAALKAAIQEYDPRSTALLKSSLATVDQNRRSSRGLPKLRKSWVNLLPRPGIQHRSSLPGRTRSH